MISLVITTMLLGAAAAATIASSSAIASNDEFFRASQGARVSVNRILSEARQCQSGVVDATSLEMTSNTGEKRTYEFDAATRKLTMTIETLPVPVTSTLAHDVESAKFTSDGKTISLTLTVKVGKSAVTLSGSALPRRTMIYQ